MGRKIVIVVFSLLSAGFLFRACQFGYKWASGASSPDFNYKALTVWSLVYVAVCAAVAWVTAKLGRSEGN